MRYLKLFIFSRTNIPLNLVLGAALTSQKNWISTNEDYFDITKSWDWRRCLGRNPNLNKLLAEHVLEHLTYEETNNFLALAYSYLNDGGTLLIAVPDGNHPDLEYRKNTGINGIGPDASDHKQFINWQAIFSLCTSNGFSVELLEGYDSSGNLVTNYHPSLNAGLVMRSRCHDIVNYIPNSEKFAFPDAWTSLIVIARKH